VKVSPLLQIPLRQIHYLGGKPAVFYIQDRDAGGILVNAPAAQWWEPLQAAGGVRYLFLPTARTADAAVFWHEQGVTLLAHQREPLPEGVEVQRVSQRQRLTRTIDFLPLPGATPGSCALHLRNKPGVVFAGAALQGKSALPPPGEDALFSALLLAGLSFQYLFWDDYRPGCHYGPEAASALEQRLDASLDG